MKLWIQLRPLLIALCDDIGLDPLSKRYTLQRFDAEGASFLTKTLPALEAAVLASLELGWFVRPTSIAWKGRSLRYYRSLLSGIFDEATGLILPVVDADCLYRLRQLCSYFYKLAFEFTEQQTAKALNAYRATDTAIQSFHSYDPFVEDMRANLEGHYPTFRRLTVDAILQKRPRNGPGSFSHGSSNFRCVPYYVEKVLGDQEVGTTLRKFGAYSGYFRPYPDCPESIVLKDGEDRTCEVLFVPKDSRGPRVISREPMHHLRAQMSFFDTVSESLTYDTHGRINFASQQVNQDLAKESSVTRVNATLDLKEGSDRVSRTLCNVLFRNCPGVSYAVREFRSTHAILPDGSTHELNKLAGMGSGLTFPCMALIIHLSICTAVQQHTRETYKNIMSRVYVYGDDVVVPTEWYDIAIRGLVRVGLMVNQKKSFVASSFRESCGSDYYNGVDVTPVRLRLSSMMPSTVSKTVVCEDGGILQFERHTRELVKAGLWNLARKCYDYLELVLGELPNITGETPVLGRYVINPDLVSQQDQWLKVYMPESLRAELRTRCPYKYLATTLEERVAGDVDVHHSWFDGVFRNGISPSSNYEEITIPRKVTLRKRRTHDILLKGIRITGS